METFPISVSRLRGSPRDRSKPPPTSACLVRLARSGPMSQRVAHSSHPNHQRVIPEISVSGTIQGKPCIGKAAWGFLLA